MISEGAKKLGEAMVAAGVLSSSQLTSAIEKASKEKTGNIIISLLDLGFLTFKVFERFLAGQNIKSAIIASHDLNPDLVLKVGAEIITSNLVVPISARIDKGTKYLALGMVDPTDDATITKVKKKTGFKVIPVLISLPDYRDVIKKNQDRIKSLEQIDLKAMHEEDDSFVILAGSNAEERKSPPSAPIPSVTLFTKTEQGPIEPFGPQGRKFKEEILVKLDLDHNEAGLLTDEIYTRQGLNQALQKISLTSLDKIYQRLPDPLKAEALANALISKGLLSKQDMLLSSAVSLAFNEDKK